MPYDANKPMRVIDEAMDADNHLFFHYKGRVKDERITPDHPTRLAGATLAKKYRDDKKEEALQLTSIQAYHLALARHAELEAMADALEPGLVARMRAQFEQLKNSDVKRLEGDGE